MEHWGAINLCLGNKEIQIKDIDEIKNLKLMDTYNQNPEVQKEATTNRTQGEAVDQTEEKTC